MDDEADDLALVISRGAGAGARGRRGSARVRVMRALRVAGVLPTSPPGHHACMDAPMRGRSGTMPVAAAAAFGIMS